MTKRQILAVGAGVLTLATGVLAVRMIWFLPEQIPQLLPEGSPPEPVRPSENHHLSDTARRLSGPYSHKNLTFFLVHGENTMTGKTPLTLEEAMERRVVIVHETGDVNELAIENVSQNEEVFVQAGDIVKGGQQDRVLAVDLIVPARSGRMPIDSFCVESQRWSARGSESCTQFNTGGGGGGAHVASKDLKLAAKHSKSQGEVWDKVAESQDKLSAATNTNAASNVSRSSLPLTLEARPVRESAETFARFLSDIVDHKSDVIGIVMIINGKINSADTYGSNALFIKLWPKLLKAASIEAVSESHAETDKNAVTAADVGWFFETVEKAETKEDRTITDRVSMKTRETDTSVLFETTDRGTIIHRNYILK